MNCVAIIFDQQGQRNGNSNTRCNASLTEHEPWQAMDWMKNE